MVATAKPKGNRTVQPGLRAMLGFAIERELPEKVKEWQALLSKDEVTDEMVTVFVAFGWLSSSQDPRLSKVDSSAPVAKVAPAQAELPRELPKS